MVLVVAGVSLVLVQRHLLRDGIVDLAQRQASELAAQVEVQGIRSPELEALVQSEDGVVQVVDPEGRVVAASGSISGSAPIVDVRPSDGETATVFTDGLPGGHDDPFAVVARGVSTPDGTAVVVSAESLESAQEATSTLVSVLAVGIPIVVLIVGGLSYWLTGRALAPVRALRARVAEIHAGDRSARVPVSPAGDEISRLAETMNAMLERLQAASAQQRRFVADASHELRSPLAAIRTAHEIGLAHPESTDWPGTSRDTLTELERLEKLVADLLLLARFDDNEPGT
ncbi:MAG TPA: histidine kinase dimerization/phospho-acceptor domain-containing protein, partial [Nocardioidaceae bacterium]